MVDDVVDLFGIEFVLDRHGHGSVGECGQESRCPISAVAPAKCYLVALLHTAVLEKDVELLYLARYILEL